MAAGKSPLKWTVFSEGNNLKDRSDLLMKAELKVRLGKTDIVVSKNGFGALPIQRVTDEEAV